MCWEAQEKYRLKNLLLGGGIENFISYTLFLFCRLTNLTLVIV